MMTRGGNLIPPTDYSSQFISTLSPYQNSHSFALFPGSFDCQITHLSLFLPSFLFCFFWTWLHSSHTHFFPFRSIFPPSHPPCLPSCFALSYLLAYSFPYSLLPLKWYWNNHFEPSKWPKQSKVAAETLWLSSHTQS